MIPAMTMTLHTGRMLWQNLKTLTSIFNMPMVNGKKYPYTKSGMKAAASAKKKKTTKKPAGKKY